MKCISLSQTLLCARIKECISLSYGDNFPLIFVCGMRLHLLEYKLAFKPYLIHDAIQYGGHLNVFLSS